MGGLITRHQLITKLCYTKYYTKKIGLVCITGLWYWRRWAKTVQFRDVPTYQD